jgi:hypothetical protein
MLLPVTNAFWSWPLSPVFHGPIVFTDLLRHNKTMHAIPITSSTINGITMAKRHLNDFPFRTSVGPTGGMDGVGGGSTAGSGALLGLNAENEPLPVEGTGTAAGT